MNKSILITGSSRGIGKAIATLAHKKRYKVILNGSKESTDLNETLQSLPGSIKTIFDVTNANEVYNGPNNLDNGLRLN